MHLKKMLGAKNQRGEKIKEACPRPDPFDPFDPFLKSWPDRADDAE